MQSLIIDLWVLKSRNCSFREHSAHFVPPAPIVKRRNKQILQYERTTTTNKPKTFQN